MYINIFSQNSISVGDYEISGDGWIEEYTHLDGRLCGRFFIGAYSSIGHNSSCENTFIGRFTSIEEGVTVGYNKINPKSFSTHQFARDEDFFVENDYIKSLKSRYFYETKKYTFIGSDVLIGKNSIVQEGVCIGNGVIVTPMSFVQDDVPDYAIVAGNPAVIIGYRYDKAVIKKLVASEWWNKNILPIVNKNNISKKYNIINYVDNSDFINGIFSSELDNLEIKRFYINTYYNTFHENKADRMIVGSSHVAIWYNKYISKKLNKPASCHLMPIFAMSLFSKQLKNLIDWWTTWFNDVILFVPDFRIGNVSVDERNSDGRFIDKKLISDENSQKCFERGMSVLTDFEGQDRVKFWFWSLFGREALNKKQNKYIDDKGNYKHPLWNYAEIYKRYESSSINIDKYFDLNKISDYIVDGSIHPTNSAYKKMIKVFDAS